MRCFILAILISSLSLVGSAQTLNQKIGKAFKELENDPNLKNGIVSLAVIDPKTGEIVFAKNEKIGLSPASTLKAITAATAYSILVSSFTYDTVLSYTGEIDQTGTLPADNIIICNCKP